MRRQVAMACLASAIAALTLGAPAGAAPSPTRLLPLHAEPDPTTGSGRIVDSRGREVLMRGVNLNALAEYWKGTEYPTVFPLAREDPRRMAAIGWNTVRLLVSWSRVEPEPGRYDERYLRSVTGTVKRLAREGIYTIVDLHQDAWGPSLAARENELCVPPSTPALGWDGAPAWATLDGGAMRCAFQFREASAAVRAAWQAFFADAEGPGGVGIQTRYVAMLRHLAGRFARQRGVAGFDVINEPNSFTPQDDAALSAMYARALAAIRAGERDAKGPRHLVLFEPTALWSAEVYNAPPDFARDRDVVFAPHIYKGGFNGGPTGRDAFDAAREAARRYGGAPVLSGEWGGDPKRAADPADPYFLDHQRLQDEYRFSATLWTWRESCGDPHKVGDYRAGRVPEVWGEFEVDCRSNEATGLRAPLIRQLTRAYVRAAPGLAAATYTEATGSFTATGTAGRRAAEIVVFYPRSKHPRARLFLRGLRGARVARTPGGGRIVTAAPRGGEYSLTIGRTPRGRGRPLR